MILGNPAYLCCALILLLASGGHSAACRAASQAHETGAAIPTRESFSTPQFAAEAERGITGSFTFTFHGPTLRAKARRDSEAPIIVRLRAGSKPGEYEARFIGATRGVFDLSERIETADGSTPEGLPSMRVNIVSTLPEDQRSDLFEAASFEPDLVGGYRMGLLAAFIAWLAIPVGVIASKFLFQPAAIAAPPPPPPATLAQQLEPLVQAATTRSLSTQEQGELELLLVHFWRQRADLPELSMAESIQCLRTHPEAGPLISAVERWLHCRDNPTLGNGSSPDEILNLLRSLPLSENRAAEPMRGVGASR